MLPLIRLVLNPQHKVHYHRNNQHDGQERRAKPIIETAGLLPTHPDRLCTPVICEESIAHGEQSYDGEEEGGDEGGLVAEIEHADCEGTEDDGEVHP